ncbi:DUF5930 domain-containing protein [Oceanibium sediminis]|uniref:DUF5930 domain-containing protein n=1 Tax=Oceanibium sediminis TaxID=2026339 RepID=UPI000DD427E6|nr:DUF5930 domain-containing protein [Oceanibium sediminis]
MTSTTDLASGAGRPTRRITIETSSATRTFDLTPARVGVGVGLGAATLGWLIVSSAGFLVSSLSPQGTAHELALVEAAFEKRIDALELALAEETARADNALSRLDLAMNRVLEQQSELKQVFAERRELGDSLAAMHANLARTLGERDAAENRAAELTTAMASLKNESTDAPSSEEMEVVLSTVSTALESAVRERDTHRSDLSRLENEIATMELRMQITADRQERLVASLEDAVEMSFRPLEKMFESSGLDVDTLVNGVRRSYSGIGGPEVLVPASLNNATDPELSERFSALMNDMDRMNMMRIAAAKLPFAMPVKQSHRFTSSYGMRRDPKTGGRRAHNGIDLAGSRGTPIEATGDGVVTFAGRQRGFGNLIKIRHAYGFETYYAHLNKIHVKTGDRIARGDHIGDMGTTGRSTGVHLHYEVRIGGKPVNPMTYIKAARDVF